MCNTFKSKSNNFEGPLILLIYFTWFTFISKVSHFQFPYSLSFLFRCLLCVTLVIFPYAFMLSKYWIYLHLYIFTVFYISVFFNPVYSHRQKAGISGVYININMYINMFIYIYISLFKLYSNLFNILTLKYGVKVPLFIYIIFLLWDLTTLCIVDQLWSLILLCFLLGLSSTLWFISFSNV